MISFETIEQDILELESRDTTYSNLTRLTPLYTAVIYDWIKHNHIDKAKPLHPRMYDKVLERINAI